MTAATAVVPVLPAGAPLPVLVDALARAAWGELGSRSAQGARAVIRGLATLLPPRSAVGLVTVAQVADAAGRSVRRTRQVLQALEYAGLITWRRGELLPSGRRPSLIRVSKRLLAALVTAARRAMPGRLARRTAQFAARLAEHLDRKRAGLVKPARRVTVDDTDKPGLNARTHGEMNSPLPPLRGRCGGRATPDRPPHPPTKKPPTPKGNAMLIIKPMGAKGQPYNLIVNPDECEICHRTPADCSASSRRDHEFVAASAREGREPTHWLMLPRVLADEAHHHSAARKRPPRTAPAPIIPITQGRIL